MKYLVIFAAACVCVQAAILPQITLTGSLESSEEEYSILLPAKNPLNLPGVGVINQPVVQAVKVKVPRYVTPEIKQQIITQTLAARGINLQSLGTQPKPTDAVPRPQRQVAAKGATASSVAAAVDSLTVAVNPVEGGKETTLPITPDVPAVLAVDRQAVPQVSTLPAVPVVSDVVSVTKAPVVVPPVAVSKQ
ncbi:PREDICTED: uncharacterized protein LOC108977759 [Bactrocera latifrons]|uniref:uncharacterized protein LOC108977759 n=1 Tax=Bactrocera latifrons TaxID=174628 RepID=UPI0008DD6B26|nr:PREDICTED: uncharacterized protein LOC108977759 [Bactrocera latifrons]